MNHLDQSFSVRFEYKVYFTSDLFDGGNPLFRDFLETRFVEGTKQKIMFVVDEGVASAHRQLQQQIIAYFRDIKGIGLVNHFIIIPGGEPAKNSLTYFNQVLEAVNDFGIDRHSYIAAIGGGAVLDLAGYVAGVSHRGIKHIRIPSTVLSQNDSGVGVKNGINYFGKKNFLGTFVPPVAVFNDDRLLLTLSDKNWRAGIAEAIKVALIKDAAFFTWIRENVNALNGRNLSVMNELIHRCASLHMQHISGGDPFELGSSRPLDFGHWSAHKLEQLSGFEVLHGEAVAMGIALDSWYSALAGLLEPSKAATIVQLLQDLGFEITHPFMRIEAVDSPVLKGLNEFREHLGGRLTIMLLKDIGVGVEVHELDPTLLMQAGEQLHAISGTGYTTKVHA